MSDTFPGRELLTQCSIPIEKNCPARAAQMDAEKISGESTRAHPELIAKHAGACAAICEQKRGSLAKGSVALCTYVVKHSGAIRASWEVTVFRGEIHTRCYPTTMFSV